MLSKKSFARSGLKIKSFASVNKATGFSDSISNVHRVVYLTKIPGKLVKALKPNEEKFVFYKAQIF